MLGAEQAGLSAGRHALAWILGQADVWYLLYRCAHFVSKGQGPPAQSSVSILEDLFTLEDEQQLVDNREEYYRNYVVHDGEGQ